MTKFAFRLEKALAWRRTQLEMEEARLSQRAAELAAIERARAELEASAIHAELDVRRWEKVAGSDLSALADYRGHVRAEEKRLSMRRAECARAVAAQRAIMLEARRKCRLLERLKERRFAEWKAAADRELDEVAAESYLAQWSASARRSKGTPRL